MACGLRARKPPWELSGRHMIRFRQLIVCAIFVLLAVQTTTEQSPLHFRQSRADLVFVVSAAAETTRRTTDDDDNDFSTSTTTTTREPGERSFDIDAWLKQASKGSDKDEAKAYTKLQEDRVKMVANLNSPVEKGTKNELPKVARGNDENGPKKGDFKSTRPPNREGVIMHSDDPKTKAEKVALRSAKYKSRSGLGSETELPRQSSTAPGNAAGLIKHSDNPKAKAEKSSSPSSLAENAKQSRSRADSANSSSTSATPAPSSTTTDSPTTTTTTTASGSPSSRTTTTEQSGESGTSAKPKASTTEEPTVEDRLRKMGGQASTMSPSLAAATPDVGQANSKAANKTRKSIKRLGEIGKSLGGKKNSSIVINGRKFDQVESVECVDDQFYQLLSKDLQLIVPGRRVDDYGAYYDYEYAKAIGAIVETPKAPEAFNANQDEGKPMVRDVVAEVRRFWSETKATYQRQSERIDHPDMLPHSDDMKVGARSAMVSVAAAALAREQRELAKARRQNGVKREVEARPRHQTALLNYQYLLHRLEELKGILMGGEDSLVVLNNRVKKLNQAPSEEELQRGLCSCITSRGGRTALALMNELFVDKDSAKTLKNLDLAKIRAEEAALDAAEYCSYWYGDTLRSEAVQKEKQIIRLVNNIAKIQKKKKQKNQGYVKMNQTTITETKITSIQGTQKVTTTERKVRIVTTLVQMTDLWLPKLASWIKKTLKLEVDVGKEVVIAPNLAQVALKKPILKKKKKKNSNKKTKRSSDFSTPFDNPSNYADLNQFSSSSLFQLRRRRQAAAAFATSSCSSPQTSARPAPHKHKTPFPGWDGPGVYVGPPLSFRRLPNGTVVQVPIRPEDNHPHKVQSYNTSRLPRGASRMFEIGRNAKEAKRAKPTTTMRPSPTKAPKNQKKVNETNFESRISKNSEECAADGFQELLSVAHDQNSLMYESQSIPKDHSFIIELNRSFKKSFAKFWKEKRDQWSRKMNSRNKANLTEMLGQSSGRSVDEEISDSFEAVGSSYDRGAKLGFTIGKFVGDKAANQWPDPAELNTFTYDSLFLAGVAEGYTERDSAKLERHIVEETAKRVAFTEANRQAFAKTVQSSYQNGAFIVPVWGVLHAQRAVAKQAAKEGAKTGFEAASEAAREFAPKAQKFFLTHKHQRQLAAPYKRKSIAVPQQEQREWKRSNGTQAWAGLSEEIGQLELESEISKNISLSAIECGQKSGFLMGALVGLVVTPEAFETYTRFRGSLEALESEFNQFKLGAMRGYELGETFAYLNYTNQMNMNLGHMKTKMGFGAQQKREQQELEKEEEEEQRQKISLDKETGTSLFEKKSLEDDGRPNTNNVFQYMVLNYGTYLVANHSRKAMLKIRTQTIDENVLRDLKIQAGDMVANPDKLHLSNELNEDESQEDPLDVQKEAVGYLTGEFNSPDNTKKRPIRFDIINLGPILEIVDQLQNGTSSRAQDGKHRTDRKKAEAGLDTTPLTAALSKVGKMFMKFSVSREMMPGDKNKKNKSKNRKKKDELTEFLNQASFDEGDGYLCGTFSQLTTHLPNGTRVQAEDPDHPTVVDDDFSLETTILDELARRIEQTQPIDGSVDLVEDVMQMTTMAPKRVEDLGEQIKSTTVKPPSRNKTSKAKAKSKSKSNDKGKSRSSLGQMLTKSSSKEEYYEDEDFEEDYLF